MLHAFWPLLLMACAMVIAHEAGHVLMACALGGRWLGVEFKGYMLGVKLSVKGLSVRQIACTLVAGPVAEALVAGTATLVWPKDLPLWFLVLILQWIINLIPWGLFPSDGTRLLQIWREGAHWSPSPKR